MGIRNHRPDLNGVLVVDKPLEWTSAQVCGLVRKATAGAKVGHAGTLDPLATGVLVLCLGRATKLIPTLMAGEKRYLASVDLAHTSPTDDLEATPEPVAVASPPSLETIRAALVGFTGKVMQAPPAHSAIWVDGTRAYKLARAGEAPELAARPIEIHSIEIVSYAWPRLELDVRCGKGTYIRSLARDLGRSVGTGGVLAGLRRTRVEPFGLEGARTVEEIRGGFEAGWVTMPGAQ